MNVVRAASAAASRATRSSPTPATKEPTKPIGRPTWKNAEQLSGWTPDDELRLQFEATKGLSDEEKTIVKRFLEGVLLAHEARRWAAEGTRRGSSISVELT
jgi:hypothetical protein